MQNISFLSFLTHLGINIFFSIKEKIFPNRGGLGTIPRFVAPGTNYIVSIFLIGTIVCVNMMQFGNVMRSSLEQGSGYKHLANLFESQSVLAQNIVLPYKKTLSATTPLYCAIPKINLMAASNVAAPAANTDNKSSFIVGGLHSTIVQPGDSLWTNIERLLMIYAGGDPCDTASTNTEANRACRDLLNKKIDKMVIRILEENGMSSTSVRPGQIVWLDASGTLWIDR